MFYFDIVGENRNDAIESYHYHFIYSTSSLKFFQLVEGTRVNSYVRSYSIEDMLHNEVKNWT